MIYVIMYRGVSRGDTPGGWIALAAVFVIGSVVAGTAAGFFLGGMGTAVSPDGRATIVALLALAGIVIATGEVLRGWRIPVLQWNRETPREWLLHRPLLGAFRTGLAIGSGFATRIGFWLWYVVPLAAFASGSVVAGAAIFGMYAVVRALVPVVLAGSIAVRSGSSIPSMHDLQDKLTNRQTEAQTTLSLAMLVLGVAYVVVT
jgi:hypothetical protein